MYNPLVGGDALMAKKRAKAKKPARKVVRKVAKKVVSKKKAPRKAAVKKAKIQGELIGKVTHYFPHVSAGVVKIKKGILAVGDKIWIKGHTTDFKETVTSLQIDRKPVTKAGKGDEIGLFVKSRVRRRDAVYKLT